MSDETVGDRIKSVRGGVSQEDFANRYGLNRNTLARYEKGDNDPSAGFLKAIAKDFGLDANWLLFGGEPREPVLTPRETALLANYRASPEKGRRSVETMASVLAESQVGKDVKDTG